MESWTGRFITNNRKDSSFPSKKHQSAIYTSASTGSNRRREYGTPPSMRSSENLDNAQAMLIHANTYVITKKNLCP